jgi:hypothetical protein
MAITYPLTPPAALKTAAVRWKPVSVAGVNISPFTGQQQVIAHRGGWWEVDIEVPPLKRAEADALEGFLLALNGREGTFYYGDKLRKASGGNPSGAWVVGSGATANTTTLPIAAGSGAFAVGDFIQVGNQLFRITQLNGATIDVFPKTRSAFAAGTAIVYTNPKGVFRLLAPIPMEVGVNGIAGVFGPWTIPLMEAL